MPHFEVIARRIDGGLMHSGYTALKVPVDAKDAKMAVTVCKAEIYQNLRLDIVGPVEPISKTVFHSGKYIFAVEQKTSKTVRHDAIGLIE